MVVYAVWDRAFLPRPTGIWDGEWVVVAATSITCHEEVPILCELWAGERLDLDKAVPRYRGAGRSISVSAVPFGPSTDIWRSCRCIGALFRALVALPGGVRRFVSCEVGANHCRLRHTGWGRCGRGLTSSPRESASQVFLNELLVFCGYPSGSASALFGWKASPSVLLW